jgi:hypothetical protein
MGLGSGGGLKHILGAANLKQSVALASVYMNVAALPSCWVAKDCCFGEFVCQMIALPSC